MDEYKNRLQLEEKQMKKYQHFINGEWTDPNSGEWFDSENPYTGEVWAQIASGNAADVDKAVKAAKDAFENGWGTSSPTYRGKLMRQSCCIKSKHSHQGLACCEWSPWFGRAKTTLQHR